MTRINIFEPQNLKFGALGLLRTLILVQLHLPVISFAQFSGADAVKAAHETKLPNYKETITKANKTEILGGFGGGDLSQVDSQVSHYKGGYGELFSPAKSQVISCRKSTTPECLATQELDRGFPDKPYIGDEVFVGRNEIVSSIHPTPGVGGTSNCKDFVIETKPVTSIEACSQGGPFYFGTCEVGWENSGVALLTRWACLKTESKNTNFTCNQPVSFGTTTQYKEKCFFGLELKPKYEATKEVVVEAFAHYKAKCTASQFVTVTDKCFDTLQITPGKSCKLGVDSISETIGDSGVINDGLEGADTATVRIPCQNTKFDALRVAYFKLNGPNQKEIKITGMRNHRYTLKDEWSANIVVKTHSCTNKVNCILKASIEVSQGEYTRGWINIVHPYVGFDKDAQGSTSWVDGCSHITGNEV